MAEALFVYKSGREETGNVTDPAPPEWRKVTKPVFARWLNMEDGGSQMTVTSRTIVFQRRLNEWRADGIVVYDEHRHL